MSFSWPFFQAYIVLPAEFENLYLIKLDIIPAVKSAPPFKMVDLLNKYEYFNYAHIARGGKPFS